MCKLTSPDLTIKMTFLCEIKRRLHKNDVILWRKVDESRPKEGHLKLIIIYPFYRIFSERTTKKYEFSIIFRH